MNDAPDDDEPDERPTSVEFLLGPLDGSRRDVLPSRRDYRVALPEVRRRGRRRDLLRVGLYRRRSAAAPFIWRGWRGWL